MEEEVGEEASPQDMHLVWEEVEALNMVRNVTAHCSKKTLLM